MKRVSETWRVVAWPLALNGAQIGVTVAATFYDQLWAQRLIYFLAALAVIGGVGYSASAESALKLKAIQAVTPWRIQLSRATDFVAIVLLVSFGFWWSAIGTLLGALGIETGLQRTFGEGVE